MITRHEGALSIYLSRRPCAQVRAPFDNSPYRNKVLSEFQTWYKLFTLKNCQKNMLINFFGTNKLTSTNFCRLCWERARTDFCSCSAQGESMHSMPHGQANGSGQRVSQNWLFPFPPGYAIASAGQLSLSGVAWYFHTCLFSLVESSLSCRQQYVGAPPLF